MAYLCVERFVDVNSIVLALGQSLSGSFPDEAGRWVGADSATQEDSLLLVKAPSNITDGLVNGKDRCI